MRERVDPGVRRWGRLEALPGFDPDAAPASVVSAYEDMTERFGTEGIKEAALARQGEPSANALEDSLCAAESSRAILRVPSAIWRIHLDHPSIRPPWRLGVDAACELRQRLDVPSGPIRNPRLSEVLEINVDRLATQLAALDTLRASPAQRTR